jgi:hypothetical protein
LAEKHLEVLKADINREIKSLLELDQEMEDILKEAKDSPRRMEMRAMGSVLHDFYCAVERIFERIGNNIDGELPQGSDWHIQLLERMAIPIEGIRQSVINSESLKNLREILAFRHIFRNVYGFELKWERFRHLVNKLPEVTEKFEEDIKSFLSSL